ncbi:MAG: alpha,alpha-trehalase TreF [Opitutaceae bacterium]|nr:alpha,alpha-trehalase TreF [Cytophagales bacterium]
MKSHDELFGDFFIEVQTSKIFKDYKTFVDSTPKYECDEIFKMYRDQKKKGNFDLETFVRETFILPEINYDKYQSDTTLSVNSHINNLWNILTRQALQEIPGSSLISLPHSYVIPGGRFREVFYWDSYFIMLGLQTCGRMDLVHSMVENFSYLIDKLGFIPNGNRTYFLTRSQPPFYALMLDLLAESEPNVLVKYLPFLEKEYNFWMSGKEKLHEGSRAHQRVVLMPDGEILNRYWDDKCVPRPEAYGKDKSYGDNLAPGEKSLIYLNVRAACESGWDFSTRWFKDQEKMQSIFITDIIPVDLNSLMYSIEETLERAYRLKGDESMANHYSALANNRKQATLKYCWDEKSAFFMDYDFVEKKCTPNYSIAGAFPLFLKLASEEQAAKSAQTLEQLFLQPGGFVTTLKSSEFQWDYPNGWAPMQWTTIKGLLNYNHTQIAWEGASRWMALNDKVFKEEGKMIEKYNVLDCSSDTGGNEYQLQDGFGWTNGVYMKLHETFKDKFQNT